MPRQIEVEAEYLLAKYDEHFTGSVAQAKMSILRTLREVLAESTQATLEPLVISVAKDGMILTRNTLLVAKSKRDMPVGKPTHIPPRFVELPRTDAIPMPDYVREELNKALRKKYDNPEGASE